MMPVAVRSPADDPVETEARHCRLQYHFSSRSGALATRLDGDRTRVGGLPVGA